MSDYKTKVMSVVIRVTRCPEYQQDIFEDVVAIFEDAAAAAKYAEGKQGLLIVEDWIDFYPQEKKREPSENS